MLFNGQFASDRYRWRTSRYLCRVGIGVAHGPVVKLGASSTIQLLWTRKMMLGVRKSNRTLYRIRIFPEKCWSQLLFLQRDSYIATWIVTSRWFSGPRNHRDYSSQFRCRGIGPTHFSSCVTRAGNALDGGLTDRRYASRPTVWIFAITQLRMACYPGSQCEGRLAVNA